MLKGDHMNDPTRKNRTNFIEDYYKLVGEFPGTNTYVRWCDRNEYNISRSTALKDLKEVSNKMGVSFREPPKHFSTKKGSSKKNSPAVEEETPAKIVNMTREEMIVQVREKVFSEYEQKLGRGWRTISKVGEANRKVNEIVDTYIASLSS